MTVDKQEAKEKPIYCDCGKIVAVQRGNKIFGYCRRCRRQVEIKLIRIEPRA